MTDIDFDQIDWKILNILQSNNQITNLDLAEAVAVSPPTCLRRLRRLRDSGVIAADVSLLNPDALGSYLMVIVEIILRTEDRAMMDAFERHLCSYPCVQQCYLVMGEIDYLLVILVKDMRAFEEFTRDALYSQKVVDRFRSLSVLRRIKVDPKIMLPLKS